MAMQYIESELRRQGKENLADTIASVHKLNGSDIPFPSAATSIEKPVAQTPETPVAIKRFSRDQLILPETQIPQEVSDILQRAERAGIRLEPYHLSNVVLDENSSVEGWNSKPERWYWEQIGKGNIGQDAPKLSDSWVLVDPITRPDYKDGEQLHISDPLGPLLAKLRKEKKIKNLKGIPAASRFVISPNELIAVVLPEIAELLGVEASAVRLPKAIEFNVIGNMKHPEWGQANTWEWFEDNFEDDNRLAGGDSDNGGLADVDYGWSCGRYGGVAFRPLVVVSPKA